MYIILTHVVNVPSWIYTLNTGDSRTWSQKWWKTMVAPPTTAPNICEQHLAWLEEPETKKKKTNNNL